MKNCNSILAIHEGMGTTQKERVRPALQPNFFLLDERNEADFILFVQRLSKYVKFYNEFDVSQGDWAHFFQKESTAILIYMASWNIELLQNLFEVKKNEILLNNDAITQKNLLLAYFTQVEEEFDDFLKRANQLDNDIIEKENLLASSYHITAKFVSVLDQINTAIDIPSLLQNFSFIKTTQQLFGLLLSWKIFSENAITFQLEQYSKHTPHYALFLSFLKLLQLAKATFNEYTKKHLDFYYKEVLHIQYKDAKPDYVHLVVEPFTTKPFLISKDTLFLAGKNTIGQKKFYALTADQTINQIKLHSFLSYHLYQDSFYKTSDLFSLNAQNKGFDVFTSTKEEFKEGLMIASPILYLQSGERIILLRFNDKNYNANDFSFYITGEEKVIEITQKQNETQKTKGLKGKSIKLKEHYVKLTIPATEKGIIPFDSKIHTAFLVQSDFPVLKIIPRHQKVISRITKIDITVKVNQFKSFVLESDFGIIDVEKPFYPFGEFPKNGNGMMLSSNEFFMKNKAVASLQMTSILNNSFIIKETILLIDSAEAKKPSNIFEKSINPLESVALSEHKTVSNEKLISTNPLKILIGESNWLNDKVDVFYLDNGLWKDYSESLTPISNNYPLKEYHFDEVVTEDIVSNGKVRIELNNSAYSGETFMQNYIKASQDKTTLPYKPRIKKFGFNYSVSETIDFLKKTNKNNPIEVYHVLPYGYAKNQKGALSFSVLNADEGYIYLGFDTVVPKDGLNFLIQLEEGTTNPLLEPATISWHYLSNNSWEVLDANALGDETYALTQSGLISVSIPDFSATTNTKLTANLFWLRITVSNIQAICNFLGIHVQAFKAVLTDYENLGTEFLEITAKETISKTYKSTKGVKKFIQPYDSFGGRLAEIDEALYKRTSERLRHKNRAITSWDYERIILEEFAEVFRVKSLNHYRYDTKLSNVSAGYVTLIIIAKSSNSENISWKPLLSLNKMLRIKEYLVKLASPHTRICVKPPKLEQVKVYFKVKYRAAQGVDTRLYNKELMNTINQYLSPWAYDEVADVNFANTIEFSSIIQLIDNQSYVDYITDFKVDQYLLDEQNEVVGNAIQNLNKITPQTNFTLFIPTETHQIQDI
jgi:hypothetical protein